MKHRIALFFIFLLLMSFEARTQIKKYDIKSGIITFETTMKMSGMTIVTKYIVYFDDYGMKECKDSYKDGALQETFFSDGKFLYTVSFEQKRAIKSGKAVRGTEFKFDWSEISERDKKSGKAKKLPDVTVAGKTCQSFEYSGTKFAGWNGICLLTEMKTKDMSSLTTALKIEENAKVPARKFVLPSGFTLE